MRRRGPLRRPSGHRRLAARRQGIVAVTFPTPEQWGGLLDEDEVDTLYDSIPLFDFDLGAGRTELAGSIGAGRLLGDGHLSQQRPQIGTALLSLARISARSAST
ncbi:MAG: hypothetical protein R2697_00635 [Ilumatobacteraceae bacterium]